MRVFDAPAIRNVALAGHSGAGKTQLASALLFTAGAVNRLGKVDEGTTVTYKLDGDTLHMTSPTGQSYDAKIGGPDVPVQGDTAKTMVSLTKTGDNAWRETDKRDGKVFSTTDITLDGDTIHAVNHDERDGSTMKYDMKRT